jgi:ATP-dependent exoDNAse (exonuclease V) alpha subunit
MRLQMLGYELERGKHGQPEIRGYTKEYLEASSPRREQIKDHLREQGIDGAAAAQIAAHHTRDRKELLSQGEVLQRHRELAARYGHQADRVVAQARQQGQQRMQEVRAQAQSAVTWARDHVFERSAVQDGRAILETALARSMGQTTYGNIQQEFQRRINTGEFQELSQIGARRQYTTRVMVGMEREIVDRMLEGNRRDYSDPMLVSPPIRVATEDRHPELNASQLQAVDEILLSREKLVGLDGVAGTGKTTTLTVIREGAQLEGYRVEGFAPTSRAAQKLGEAGIETSTLQKHLARGQQPDTGEKRLYVLDESSLASTRQLHEFIERLRPNDRVLLVGDRRQHEAVEAGRPFAQLQDAGMKTVKLEEIVRQEDPELKEVVQQLARGNVQDAINNLDQQGRVHEIPGRDERISAIAKEYAKSPQNTLVVSPDNRSRMEINERIHAELQGKGEVSGDEHLIRTLVPRQELTGADRTWAAKYEVGDILRYSRASKETGIGKGQYAQVLRIDAASNRLTVRLRDGTDRTYSPRRQRGVSLFREEVRRFSIGDRVQFTAPANDLKIANRELGVVAGIDDAGRVSLRMDSGRSLEIDANKHPHLDYGYAMTSHSSQGQTANRVLIHVDTELAAKGLLNTRMAYVSVSRGALDARLFTNDRQSLPAALGHDVSKQIANSPQISTAQTIAPQQEISRAPQQEHGMGLGVGF